MRRGSFCTWHTAALATSAVPHLARAQAAWPKVERLAAELRKVLTTADVKAGFAGAEVQARGPAEFAANVLGESDRWSVPIAKRNIKLD